MITLRLTLVGLTVCAALALAGDFSLDWWTIDGGGGMGAAGGDFEVSGTIGQPDAGVVMTGGDFELTGGFWAISPTSGCIALAWRSVKMHEQGVGELAIELEPAGAGDDVVSESRRDGIAKIEVDFNTDVTDLLTGTIEAEDLTHGGSTPASSQTLTNGGTTLVIEFDPALPDEACYEIDLAGHVAGLSGDTDCLVRALTGNTNGGGVVDLIDLAQVRSENGSDPAQPGNARFDVNLSGRINMVDVSLTKSRRGTTASCP